MPLVFGPVPSRRLGLSLGIDLIPPKTCSYDCLYCQVGATTCKSIEPKPYVEANYVINELEEVLKKSNPDIITFSGSGEPTLNSKIGEAISAVKKITDIEVALLTNGSLLQFKEIRERALGADIIIPTLTSVFDKTFRTIHRPHLDLFIKDIIGGLIELRKEYKGKIYLETVLLAGINDSESEITGLAGVIKDISPDKIQLNTVVRPPADSKAVAVDERKMTQIKEILGEKAEIIVPSPLETGESNHDTKINDVLEMVKRRPVTFEDILTALKVNSIETERLLKALKIKGKIREQDHGGTIFFTAK
jgi:wyosine [tRNA(Phe)-imidazoG37] synthetase (radical SAM superfamily)